MEKTQNSEIDKNAQKTKERAKSLAEKFNLNYNENQFDYYIISPRESILISFLHGSQDPDLLKEGFTSKKPEERINELPRYINSNHYKNRLASFKGAGQVIRKSKTQKGLILSENIKETNLRNEIKNFYKNLSKQYKSHRITVLASKTEFEKETAKYILLHEIIHRLLFDEKINFSNLNEDYWIYDEGLAVYLTYYSLGKLKKLRTVKPRTAMKKIYHSNAQIFDKLLKNKKSPRTRKEAILNLYNSLQLKSSETLTNP